MRQGRGGASEAHSGRTIYANAYFDFTLQRASHYVPWPSGQSSDYIISIADVRSWLRACESPDLGHVHRRSGSQNSLDSLILIAVLFLGVAVGTQLVTVAETYVAENVGLTATNRIRSDLAFHTLRLDPIFTIPILPER